MYAPFIHFCKVKQEEYTGQMDLLKLWDKISEGQLHKTSILFAGTLFILGIIISIDKLLSKYVPSQYLIWLYLAVLILWIIYWLHNRFYISKNKKGKTGLVLCIFADSNEAQENLKKDFILSLQRQISNENIRDIFNIIVVKNHLAQNFNNFKNIGRLHKKIKGHIYIFGETKKRKNGGDEYFMSLDGLVLHRPIAKNFSDELSKDFIATLPKGINFKEEFAFLGFQVSANVVISSVKYVVGVASFLSGNPFLAIRLHTNLKKYLQDVPINKRLPGDNIILSKINNVLANEHALVAQYYFSCNDRVKTIENLNLSLGLNHYCYRALILKSIINFVWEDDPIKSLEALKKCHGFNSPEWRYNEAFLYFWLGRYPEALKLCEKIKIQSHPNEFLVAQEVVEFNENLLSKEGSTPALYFWVGFNYYYKLDNLPMALENLEKFEKSATPYMLKLKQKSSLYIAEIKNQIGIEN